MLWIPGLRVLGGVQLSFRVRGFYSSLVFGEEIIGFKMVAMYRLNQICSDFASLFFIMVHCIFPWDQNLRSKESELELLAWFKTQA